EIFAEPEIGGREADRAAAPVADHDSPVDLPIPAELGGCLARLAGFQQFADMGRGIDRRVGVAYRIDDRDAEALLGAGGAQQFGRAAAAVAEGAVMTDDDMAEADRAEHHLLDKGFGALLREIEVEMLDEQQVDAEPLDLALLDPKRGQPIRLAFRHEDAARVRLE